jgi:hypothetical protein
VEIGADEAIREGRAPVVELHQNLEGEATRQGRHPP